MNKEEELKRLKLERKFMCPKCGAFGRFRIVEDAGGRWGGSEHTVKCLNCGHMYGVYEPFPDG